MILGKFSTQIKRRCTQIFFIICANPYNLCHLRAKTIQLAVIIIFLVSCDGFEKDLDGDFARFPPKLAVTAILDRNGESGESAFSITICEGRSLADYREGIAINRQIKAPGSITLLEDDVEIFTESGEFDMSIEGYNSWGDQERQYGYKYDRSGFVTHAGRTYRLVVEVEGYAMVTSASTMPDLPAITASADTNALVSKGCVADIYSLNPSSGSSWGCRYSDNTDYCTVTLSLDARSSVNNYYAVEMSRTQQDWMDGVYVADLNHFHDNPDVEAFNGMNGMFDEIGGGSGSNSNSIPDMYRFFLLLMNDNNFSREHSSLNVYSPFQPSGNPNMNLTPGQVFVISRYVLNMRIRHITTATFNYYRSLAMQNTGMGFFSEPVNIAGNIENGYGVFSVYNSKEVSLLDYDVYLGAAAE